MADGNNTPKEAQFDQTRLIITTHGKISALTAFPTTAFRIILPSEFHIFSNMQLVLTLACVLLYLSATVMVSGRWFHKTGPLFKPAIYAAIGGLSLHLIFLINAIWTNDGQNFSIMNVGAMTSWLITAIMVAVSVKNQQTFLLPLVTGFSAIIIAFAGLIPGATIVHIEMQPGLIMHISLALLAYGCLSIAFLYALQLSFINRRLKQKNTLPLHSSMPPLMQVEQNLFHLLIFGTVLLSLSLASGFFFLDDMFAQRQAHKTILTSIAFVMYLGLLIYHKKFGMRDNTIVAFSVVGILLLTLAYFGSRFVKEVILG